MQGEDGIRSSSAAKQRNELRRRDYSISTSNTNTYYDAYGSLLTLHLGRHSADAAEEERAYVSHNGACGLCSTAADLAAYIEVRAYEEELRRQFNGILSIAAAKAAAISNAGNTNPICRTTI